MRHTKPLLALFLITLSTNVAQAATPTGLWKVKQYDFSTKKYINTVEYCLYKDGTLKHRSPDGVIDYFGHWKKSKDLVLMRLNSDIHNAVAENTLTIA